MKVFKQILPLIYTKCINNNHTINNKQCNVNGFLLSKATYIP